jgi:hypothetical protein
MSIGVKMMVAMETKIQHLGEDVYEHFLREAGDCTDPEEWYQMALAVAELFRQEILHSADRNMVTLAGYSPREIA